jgi:hypothetical protein
MNLKITAKTPTLCMETTKQRLDENMRWCPDVKLDILSEKVDNAMLIETYLPLLFIPAIFRP